MKRTLVQYVQGHRFTKDMALCVISPVCVPGWCVFQERFGGDDEEKCICLGGGVAVPLGCVSVRPPRIGRWVAGWCSSPPFSGSP